MITPFSPYPVGPFPYTGNGPDINTLTLYPQTVIQPVVHPQVHGSAPKTISDYMATGAKSGAVIFTAFALLSAAELAIYAAMQDKTKYAVSLMRRHPSALSMGLLAIPVVGFVNGAVLGSLYGLFRNNHVEHPHH